jgi:hypothetical protein
LARYSLIKFFLDRVKQINITRIPVEPTVPLKQVGAPTVPSAVIKRQLCYWSGVIHYISCHIMPYHVISCVVGLFRPAFKKSREEEGQICLHRPSATAFKAEGKTALSNLSDLERERRRRIRWITFYARHESCLLAYFA